MIGAPVPGVVNALQVTIPGRSPSVPSVKVLGNARDEKKIQCGSRRSVHQLLGTQIGTLKHSCSITAGHSAMASNRERPEDMTFQI